MKEEQERPNKNAIVTFRFFQALFWGIFALGLSLSFGDASKATSLPISSLSITLLIFGFVGALLSGHFAKRAESW